MAALALLAVTTCGGTESVQGTVIEVEGGLAEITGFLLRLPDGADLRLTPAAGALFDGEPSLGHLRDHLRSGIPVVVEYEVLDDGTAVATAVRDAG